MNAGARGVGDVPHTGGGRRLDGRLVLPAAARTYGERADEQQPLAAFESFKQSFGAVEVAVADLDAAGRGCLQPLGPAGDEDQVRRANPPKEQLREPPAVVPGGSRDDDAHERCAARLESRGSRLSAVARRPDA